jgi:hypothetical protein
MLTNAKQELIDILGNSRIVVAQVTIIKQYNHKEAVTIELESNYTQEEFETFLNALDFEYDRASSYDVDIRGNIWFSTTEWLERHYDENYLWIDCEVPIIPRRLLK